MEGHMGNPLQRMRHYWRLKLVQTLSMTQILPKLLRKHYKSQLREGNCDKNLERTNSEEAVMKRYVVMLILFFLFFPAKIAMAYDYTADISLSLSEEYNDNIFLEHSSRDSDFVTYISPAIGLSIRSVNSVLRLGYSTSFSFYGSHPELNEPAHNFTANGNFTLSNKLSLTLTDTYVKSSEISDIRAIPDIGPITGRIERRLHTISSNISYRLRDNLSYIIGASYSDTDYKESGFNEVKTYSGNMGLSYRHSERTSLSANARYTKYDYRPSSDATGQDYSLGITYLITPTLTLGLTGGATTTKIEDTGESDTGFSGGVELTKRLARGEAALSFRQAVIAGVETGTPLRDQTVSLRLTRPLTNQLAASISASYSNFKSIETNDYDTNETLLSTNLTYSFMPWASLALSYSYVNSDDKIANTSDYYNNIFFLTLRLSYSRRL